MSVFFHQCPVEERPKILGLSASPYFGKGDIMMNIRTIENNLGCIAIYPDIKGIQKSIEIKKLYYSVEEQYQKHCGIAFEDLERDCSESKYIRDKVISNFQYVYKTMGPWCAKASYPLTLKILENELDIKMELFPSLNKKDSNVVQGVAGRYSSDKALSKYHSVRKIIEEMSTNLGLNWKDKLNNPTPENLSCKVSKLIEFLRDSFNENTRCIVFVERRITAVVLYFLFSNHNLIEKYRFGYAIGKQQSNGYVNSSEGLAAQTLHDLKHGKINVIFATKVCEEGIDIYNCSMVIRFDEPKTYVSYIQSRGRLRSDKQLFVVMLPISSDASSNVDYTDKYASMEKTINQLISDSKRTVLSSITIPTPRLTYPNYKIIKTKGCEAVVTPNNALSVLVKYCTSYCRSSTPKNQEVPSIRYEIIPDGPGNYACAMFLPRQMNSEVSEFIVRNEPSKSAAKAACAIAAVFYLIGVNRIDGRLRGTDIPVNKIEKYTPDSQVYVKVHYNMRLPSAISHPFTSNTVNITLIFKKSTWLGSGFMSLGILTPGKLDIKRTDYDILFDGKDYAGCFVPIKATLKLSNLQMEAIKSFHYTLFKSVLRSKIECDRKWTLLVFPVSKAATSLSVEKMNEVHKLMNCQSLLDWCVLKNFTPRSTSIGITETLRKKNYIFYDSVYYKRCYIVKNLRSKLNPDSIVYNGHLGSSSMFYSSRLGIKISDIIKDQPLIEATALPYIHQWTSSKPTRENSVYLLPQFCKVIPIPTRIMKPDALLLPATLCLLEIKLKAIDLAKKLIPSDYEALWGPLDMEQLETCITTPVCHLPWNYERLEFMGDSTLKLIQSLHLFFRFAEHSEGSLSLVRSSIENNYVLSAFGKELRLTDYMYAYQLSRKDYQPPDSMRQIDIRISDNMVADTLEAIIGSCDVHAGFEAALNVSREVFKVAAKVSLFDMKLLKEYTQDILGIYSKVHDSVTLEFINVEEVEKIIGYNFKKKSILVEALTHSSSVNSHNVRTYQRLEFLGDSLLGYVIARKIFHKYKTYGPGPMTHMKASLVNNKFLSIISYNLKLYKYLDHTSPAIIKGAESVSECIKLMNIDSFGLKNTPIGTEGYVSTFPWKDMEYSKTLGDLYEAVVGAIYIDSGLDIQAVDKLISVTLYDPWIWRFDNSNIITENMEKTSVELYNEHKNNVCIDIEEVIKFEKGKGTIFKIISHNIIIAEAVASRKRVARELCIEKALNYIRDNPCPCLKKD